MQHLLYTLFSSFFDYCYITSSITIDLFSVIHFSLILVNIETISLYCRLLIKKCPNHFASSFYLFVSFLYRIYCPCKINRQGKLLFLVRPVWGSQKRELRGTKLIVFGGYKGIQKTVRDSFIGSSWQMFHVCLIRQALKKVPIST